MTTADEIDKLPNVVRRTWRYGFVGTLETSAKLSPPFDEVHELALRASEYLKEGALGDAVNALPHITTLPPPEEQELAKMAYSFLTQAYVWEPAQLENGRPRTLVPKQLSQPLIAISRALDEPPIYIYSDHTLRNSRLIDGTKAASLENLQSVYTFSGTDDEDQFVVVHTAYESIGIPAIRAAIEVTANNLSHDDIIGKLDMITNCIAEMRHEFMKVRSIVSPTTFRDKIRLFLMGWHSNLPAIEYEGVDFDASMLRGETGAGSVLLPFLDRFAGLLPFQNEDSGHADHLKTYLDFDSYRPRWHREALNWMASETKLREQALMSDRVASSYNDMVEQIVGLRSDHLRTVGAYMKGSSHPNMQDGYGTGGSSYSEYLLALVNMSKIRRIS